jgi:hypothetical protein
LLLLLFRRHPFDIVHSHIFNKNNIAVRGIVTRRLFDANGKPKKMFKENAIWELIKETFNLDLKILQNEKSDKQIPERRKQPRNK